MNNLDERSLSLDVYKYLDVQDRNHPIRTIGVITDNQSILYSQIKISDHMTHDEILDRISKEVYGDREDALICNEDNALVVGVGKHFNIYLPENNNLSNNQYNEICNILD